MYFFSSLLQLQKPGLTDRHPALTKTPLKPSVPRLLQLSTTSVHFFSYYSRDPNINQKNPFLLTFIELEQFRRCDRGA